MAIKLIATEEGEATKLSGRRHLYIGTSSDEKPTMASHTDLPAPNTGSEFYAYDTGITFITYNGTDWVEKINYGS